MVLVHSLHDPNHLNTLWSTLLANSLSIPAQLLTSSFQNQSIRDTSTKHWAFREHSLSLLSTSHTPCHCTKLRRWCSALHLHTDSPLPIISYCSAHFSLSPRSIPLIYYFYRIPFTSSIRYHLRPSVLKRITSSNGSLFSLSYIQPPFTHLEHHNLTHT